MITALDIETVPALGPDDAGYEAVASKAEEKGVTPETWMSLCPPLASVVCIGLTMVESPAGIGCDERNVVLYDETLFDRTPEVVGVELYGYEGEAALLGKFAEVSQRIERFVTYNGRGYDFPVLVHRSAALGVQFGKRAWQAFQEYRYKPDIHIDLLDVMTGHGAAVRVSLNAMCIAYGIDSPKADFQGSSVLEMVRGGNVDDLVTYNIGDCQATLELYSRWLAVSP